MWTSAAAFHHLLRSLLKVRAVPLPLAELSSPTSTFSTELLAECSSGFLL